MPEGGMLSGGSWPDDRLSGGRLGGGASVSTR
jgi:hypothetical protein